MLVKVRLYATLHKANPVNKSGDEFEVDLPAGSTVTDLIVVLSIRPNEVKAIRINGRARAEMYRLHDNDEVDLFPPIGGG